jgi:phage shock protein E
MKSLVRILLTAFMATLLALVPSLCQAQSDKKPKASSAVVTHTDAKEAAKLLAKGEVTVLDVRTPGEYAGGRITGATNIDFLASDFADKISKLDREKTYLVHCASGGRSTKCLPQLEKAGFKRVIHLDGGFKAWQAAGNPVEKK